MYRENSETARGFTLMEVTVALVASAILIVGLARFFKGFSRNFNSQEQVSDRDLNTHYAVKRLSEALMAAGSNLPAKNWPIISLPSGNPGSVIRIGVNPRGGVQYLSAPMSGSRDVPVDDAKAFAKATAILADPQDPLANTFMVHIDQAYMLNGFKNGIKTVGQEAILRLDSNITLEAGDAVYAYDIEEYKLLNGNLMLDSMVLAENIQNLSFTTYTVGQVKTTDWNTMRSAKVSVTGRTRSADPGLGTNGGYRLIDLSMDVLLRNRL